MSARSMKILTVLALALCLAGPVWVDATYSPTTCYAAGPATNGACPSGAGGGIMCKVEVGATLRAECEGCHCTASGNVVRCTNSLVFTLKTSKLVLINWSPAQITVNSGAIKFATTECRTKQPVPCPIELYTGGKHDISHVQVCYSNRR